VAEDFEDLIRFAWLDATVEHVKEKKRALGLFTEILPAVAFNLMENRQIAFDEGKPVNYQNLKEFVQNFLEDKVGNFRNKPQHNVDPELMAKYTDVEKIGLD
jgi:hypothetical protein